MWITVIHRVLCKFFFHMVLCFSFSFDVFLFRLEAGWKLSRHLGTQDRHVPRERADGSCRWPAACQLRNRAADPQVGIAIQQVLLSVPSPVFTFTLGGSIKNMEITYKSWHRCRESELLSVTGGKVRWFSCCTESMIIQYVHCGLTTGPVIVSWDMLQPCYRSGVPNSPKPKKQVKCPSMNRTWCEPTIEYSLASQAKNVFTDTTV